MPYFDAHLELVDKINAPLLVIGLGGSGADAVRRIKYEFRQRFVPEKQGDITLDRPPRTAYLLLDTDQGEVERAYHGTKLDRDTEFVSLQANVEKLLSDDGHNLTPQEKIWLDPHFYKDENLRKDAATNGAGTYRQLSRLMLFRKAAAIQAKVSSLLANLAAVAQGAQPGERKINVVIVSGLSGGTGSGTFLDIAYLIRDAAKKNGHELVMDLYALAPDLTIAHHASENPTAKEIYQANSFAAFKELDYWMTVDRRREGSLDDKEMKVPYSPSLTVTWSVRPYDSVTLLCATDANGTLLQNAYQVVLNSLAETLVFTMAAEANRGDVVGTDYSKSDDSFSFQSAKSNEFAYLLNIRHDYPEEYCYRAIAAYSNLSEQRNRVSLEGNLLFSDVCAFCALPEHMPEMKGVEPQQFFDDFWDIIGDMQVEFANATRFDESMFSRLPPWDWKTIKQGDPGQAPHNAPFDQWYKSLETRAAELTPEFRKRLRDRFLTIAKQYILARGPSALQLMLDEPNQGFRAKLLEKIKSTTTEAESQKTACNTHTAQAAYCFDSFLNSQLGSQQSSFAVYTPQANEMYVNAQNHVCCEKLAGLLQELSDNIAQQISATGLAYAIKALEQMASELSEDVHNIPPDGNHLVSFNNLKDDIEKQYLANSNNIALRNAVLEAVSDIALGTLGVHTDAEASDIMVGRLQALLDNTFSAINDMSLTTQLNGAGHTTPAAIVNYAKTVIAPGLERGAQVHFALNPSYGVLTPDTAVLTSYVSVPAKATDISRGINAYIATSGLYSGANIKASSISDRIFWLNIHSGLPLCAYRFMGDYEEVYEKMRCVRYGLHLLMNDQKELTDNVQYNWANLPSPYPGMLFSTRNAMNSQVLERFDKAMAICTKAEENGLIQLNTASVNDATFSADFCLLRSADGSLYRADTLKDRMDQIIASVTTPDDISKLRDMSEAELDALSAALQEEQKAIQMLIADRAVTPIGLEYVEQRDAKFAQCEGVSTEYGQIITDQTSPAESKRIIDAHRKCFRALVYYRISKRPVLMAMLQSHADMAAMVAQQQEKVEQWIESLKQEKTRRGDHNSNVINTAIHIVAPALLFDKISLLPTSVLYRDSIGEYQNNGEKNMLYTVNMGVHAGESWAGFLPLLFSLTEWYSNQDQTNEPFTTIAQQVQEKTDETATTDDTEMLTGYYHVAEEYSQKIKLLENNLRKNQAKIGDPACYALAMKVLQTIDDTMCSMTNFWAAL